MTTGSFMFDIGCCFVAAGICGFILFLAELAVNWIWDEYAIQDIIGEHSEKGNPL